MVHSAYDTVELVAGVPGRIEAVVSHAGTLLVADSKCSLHIYSAPVPADGEIRRDGPYALERQQPRLCSKAPSAMEASASRDLLLSLSYLAALHRLLGLETVAFISKTKSANIFTSMELEIACW